MAVDPEMVEAIAEAVGRVVREAMQESVREAVGIEMRRILAPYAEPLRAAQKAVGDAEIMLEIKAEEAWRLEQTP